MLGTLIWRVREATAVLLGRKKTQKELPKQNFSEKNLTNLKPFKINDEKLNQFLSGLSIEFIFSEFNEERVNAGGADLSQQLRLDPSLSTLKKYFPNAKYTVYSDFDLKIEGINLKKIENPVLQDKKNLKRHFYHLADYYKFKGMLESEADIAISIDSDMYVLNDNVYSLIYLTEKFGFCVPNSSAQSMNFEIETSLDTIPITDESKGFGTTSNITPMTLSKKSEVGKIFYQNCCEIMEKEPSRASIVMWKAAWKTGNYPYLLPKEFCVCRGNEGLGNEVILHVGHPSVAQFYNVRLQ
ncbi:hypothetical protein ACFOWU_13725 [Epilithonimonas zeae]|uniref:Glycosyl transferase n=1 Tax=Epilithonimonas zeae TaxID=1416779 RepID=A0A1N6ITD8_9FLAO|nr:hypothetical protein [Epilithonimonas zeae]SIO35224.1 hypothetical protein SAMN05444409_2976 [Epilithonimonas zeae]